MHVIRVSYGWSGDEIVCCVCYRCYKSYWFLLLNSIIFFVSDLVGIGRIICSALVDTKVGFTSWI